MDLAVCRGGAPLVYLLSAPPLAFGVMRLTSSVNPPPWVRTYAEPYKWLLQNTALKSPLTQYAEWWAAQFRLQ